MRLYLNIYEEGNKAELYLIGDSDDWMRIARMWKSKDKTGYVGTLEDDFDITT